MTFKLQAQAGSRRRSCGVTPRTISGMPSSTERDEWGACTSFGRVLKAADITSVRPGSARCGIAQPCLTLSGQRSKRGAPYGVSCGREVSKAYPPARSYNPRPTGAVTMATRALKVRPHRSRQNNVSEPALVAGVGGHWQGTLTITGSNVRLGTEMPVALSSFCK